MRNRCFVGFLMIQFIRMVFLSKYTERKEGRLKKQPRLSYNLVLDRFAEHMNLLFILITILRTFITVRLYSSGGTYRPFED